MTDSDLRHWAAPDAHAACGLSFCLVVEPQTVHHPRSIRQAKCSKAAVLSVFAEACEGTLRANQLCVLQAAVCSRLLANSAGH